MDHQSFRFQIPGTLFLIPISIVVGILLKGKGVMEESDIRILIFVGFLAAFPQLALTVGWWIYNIYRVIWIKWKKGYENKDFVKLIRKDTMPFYCPRLNSILINFGHIKDIESWIKIDTDLFRKTFCPFTDKPVFDKEIEKQGIHTKFAEHLSDFLLWKDPGYDYSRSISSVRYGLEGSVVAILSGSLYALGIWLINQRKDIFLEITGIAIVVLLTVGAIYALWIRWKQTSREYDARLVLTTLTSMRSAYFDPAFFRKEIPDEIAEKIDQLDLSKNSYAAFDLDNTVLNDDIGEAVFATLIQKRHIISFSWKDYLDLIEVDREKAYKTVIEAMNNLEVNTLMEITREVIENKDEVIKLGEYKIPVPKPNPVMRSLLAYLNTKGIDVYIVTASNKLSAEIICWKYFGIPSCSIIGAEFEVVKNKIQYDFSEIPFGQGKVNALQKKTQDRPLITGGDGHWDKPLLDYTAPGGIRLWLGNKKAYNKLKEEQFNNSDFFRIGR